MELVSSADVIKTAEDNAAEEAAFRGVFTGDVEPPNEEIKEPVEVEVPEEEPPAEEIKADAEPGEKQLTLDDLRAMIVDTTEKSKQQISKLGGKLGELQQRIESAKVAAAGISPKAKERLSKDFPELVELLFDEQEEPTEPATKPVQAPSGPKEMTVEELQEAQDLLTFDHPDWELVVKTTEFSQWVSTLPPTIAKRLNETYDPAFVSDKLTRFKTFQAATAKERHQQT